MAILTGGLPIIGSLQGLSTYKMRGSDKIVVRSKGGATKNRFRNWRLLNQPEI